MIRQMSILLLIISTHSFAEVSATQMDKLLKLNIACEQDRQAKLKDRKKDIYQECIHHFKKSEEVCQDEAQGYNGQRKNGAPLFYELPSCVKAFEFKKTLKEN